MISHQLEIGELNDGQTGFVKFAADGTNITRREIATAATLSLSDSKKALLVGTVALVMAGETYQVTYQPTTTTTTTPPIPKCYKETKVTSMPMPKQQQQQQQQTTQTTTTAPKCKRDDTNKKHQQQQQQLSMATTKTT